MNILQNMCNNITKRMRDLENKRKYRIENTMIIPYLWKRFQNYLLYPNLRIRRGDAALCSTTL
jgi:hypothetical protein